MKNNIMEVKFEHGVLHIGHASRFGSLTDMFTIGNEYRFLNKLKPVNQTMFMNTQKTKNFLSLIEKKIGCEAIKKTGRGSQSRTEAHLYFLIYVAEHLSPSFHLEVIEAFVEGQLLKNRDEGGEAFKRINELLLEKLPSPRGNDNGRRIQVAKMVRAKCEIEKPEDKDSETWNQVAAGIAEQARRKKILESIELLLSMGAVKDFDHLKEIIAKI